MLGAPHQLRIALIPGVVGSNKESVSASDGRQCLKANIEYNRKQSDKKRFA